MMPPRERVTLVLICLWVGGMAALVLWLAPSGGSAGTLGPLYAVIASIGILMPPALVWVGLMALRAIRVIREETAHLEAAIDALRDACAHRPAEDETAQAPIAVKLDEIAAAQTSIKAMLAELRALRPQPAEHEQSRAGPPPPARDDQVTLPLDMPPEPGRAGLARSDFIKALHFPETADDKEGFTALRRALRDRSAAQVIRAAQDILTLMSQDGIYMDDLPPDMTHPDLWRRFAGGERGRAIAAVGGVRDRDALTAVAARMKRDAVFRDVAHHFLRLYDRMFAEFAQTATDAEISDLSDTRTARAFMLLGRTVGTFD